MDVSIIVVNYNTRDLTLQCLQSIYDKTEGVEFEVIVVDNASGDDSVECIKEAFPQVKVIEISENLGFGKANNWGIQYARGQYLFMLNSDTILLNNAVKIFYDTYNVIGGKIGVLGAIMMDANRNETGSWAHFPCLLVELKALFPMSFVCTKLSDKDYNSFISNKYCNINGYITGADMFMSKDLFDHVGGFDKYYFMYSEEVDLQKRICALSYKNYLVYGPEIIHLEGRSQKSGKNNKRRLMYMESKMYYLKTHLTAYQYYIYRILACLIRLPSILDNKYTWKERMGYLKFMFFHKVP